jgi:hypothetical protein
VLIKDFKDFKFPNKNDQVANLRQLRLMESKCSDMKTEFDSITYKITRQNKSIIDSHRVSRVSFPNTPNYQEKSQIVLGNDLLAEERLVEKEKVNITIEKYVFLLKIYIFYFLLLILNFIIVTFEIYLHFIYLNILTNTYYYQH